MRRYYNVRCFIFFESNIIVFVESFKFEYLVVFGENLGLGVKIKVILRFSFTLDYSFFYFRIWGIGSFCIIRGLEVF